ncbi:unnamed protein product [Hymenolepis diminuta]|uniref:3Beta_HSD domain-containing protein n=1 Tax=Hymenolepis diminuta TaxID=6216 RepID=A0A0R3SLP3_HYMDI|nr:unnamed protein product [Hymenolepis diminuta]
MRVRRERLDIFINTKEDEVGAQFIVLSASFPIFGEYLSGSDVVHRYYCGTEKYSTESHPQIISSGTKPPKQSPRRWGLEVFVCQGTGELEEPKIIEETNVSEVWSATNTTKNEVLIGVCAPLVAMNLKMFRTSRLFHVTTEIKGMMNLLGCPRMAQASTTSKVEAPLEWRNA